MIGPADAERHYLDEIPVLLNDPYVERRREALREFFGSGAFPTRRDEDWRFSELDGLGRTVYRRNPVVVDAPRKPPKWAAGFRRRVVLHEGGPANGADFRSGNGLAFGDLPMAPSAAETLDWGFTPAGTLPTAAEADVDAPLRHPLEVLNAALFDCGFRVRVGPDREAGPILLHSLRWEEGTTQPRMLHPRSVIEVGRGSRLTVIEAHDGAFGIPGWTNPTTLCRIGPDAELRYVRLELETGGLVHTGRVRFDLERNARVHSTVLSLTGNRSRTDTAAMLLGEGAEATLEGLFLGVGRAKADQHTLALHAARNTGSHQLFKNVLADRASAVFDGKVVVAPGAAGTDASQSNRNLLLSREARVHTRPRLEILNDDVKCAHGAAIGRLDEDAMFYLRSRGLGPKDAREMLVEAFAGELIRKLPGKALRDLAESGLRGIRASRSWTA